MTIGCWNNINISQSAKLIVINSIILGTIMHRLSIFQIPTSIVNKIDSLIAMFFWKDSQGKGNNWKKCNIIQTPRCLGGLGILNMGCINVALLMKKAWRIKGNPHLLFSKVYHRLQHCVHSRSTTLGNLRGDIGAFLMLIVFLTNTAFGRLWMVPLFGSPHINGWI